MNKTITRLCIFVLVTAAAILTACESPNDLISGENYSVDPSEYFDFSTVFGCPIEISYDRKTLINVYDVDPYLNPDALPIYATFTDMYGHYSGNMQLPSAYMGKQLWAKGFGFDDTATVGRNGVKFSATFNDPRTRAINDDDIQHLFTEDQLAAECKRLYELYLQRLPEQHNNTSKLSETKNLALYTIKDDTELIFSFVNSGARYVSQLYYFYFPQEVDATEYMKNYVTKKAEEEGKEPDLSSLNLRTEFMRIFTNDAKDPYKKFLLTRDWGVFYTGTSMYNPAQEYSSDEYLVKDKEGNKLSGNGFTNAKLSYSPEEINAAKANNIIQPKKDGSIPSWNKWNYQGYGYINRNFNNNVGAHHHLRFYGPNYDQEPTYKFPAGYRIGFILKVHNMDKNTLHCLTTNNELNLNGNVQCARNLFVSDFESEHDVTNIVYGYEDKLLENINKNDSKEPDYNDFMFMITATPAVSTVGMERISENGKMFIDGTLLYEDLYPDAGDYDMNDVMVEYEMWVYFDDKNKVTKIESTFWPINYGATYDDDFYLELRTDDNKGNVKQFIQPDRILSANQLRTMSAQNMNNIKAGERPKQSVKCTYEFTAKDGLHRDSVTIENFNPFIYVHNTNREVHMTNGRFCGVNGASNSGLTDGQMKYYPLMINNGSALDGCYFPYAMNVPRRFSSVSMEGFTPVTESIYIILEYQLFLEWMKNPNDENYKAWYNYYTKWGGR